MKENAISLGLSLDVFLPKTDARLQAIRNSIKQYRTTAKQMFGAVFEAQATGATVKTTDETFTVVPQNDRAKVILALAFDKMKSFQCGPFTAPGETSSELKAEIVLYRAPAYELRDEVLRLNPTWKPFVWDSMRAKTWAFWTAKDPEFTKASRGWLLMQSARNLAQCRGIGIEFPQMTAKPKLLKRSIVLNWDRAIGEVEFELPPLDAGRWRNWKNIREGVWKPGTVTLNERDGRFYVLLSYHSPVATAKELDPESVLTVCFNPDAAHSFISMSSGKDVETLSAVSAREKLREMTIIKNLRERRTRACGSKVRAWGGKKVFVAEQTRVHRVALERENVVDTWCHLWSRKIADCARRKRCGAITMALPPETMLGHPFPFAKLKTYSEYKALQLGIKM